MPFFLAAHLWLHVSWEVLPGQFERQQKALRSELSRAFSAVSFSSEVLEAFPGIGRMQGDHWGSDGHPR